jgi:hypothetical protein
MQAQGATGSNHHGYNCFFGPDDLRRVSETLDELILLNHAASTKYS